MSLLNCGNEISRTHEGWQLAVTVNGQNVQIPTGPQSLAAIDTGTTLVGGPSEAVQNIFASIPGHQPLDGDLQGFYAFRMYILTCNFFFGF